MMIPSLARKILLALILIVGLNMISCMNNDTPKDTDKYDLIVLDPGHFHAALVQKSVNDQLDNEVKVFAPEGPEVKAYLDLVDQYNQRSDQPTHWKEEVYTGSDYLEKMLSEAHGKNNIVVLAGNNEKKTDYILESVKAGLNVFADKPMAIDAGGFEKLKQAFEVADDQGVLLYDIMTERYEITNRLQKEFSKFSDIFGELKKGTEDDPAVYSESVHHFHKEVSGKPLIRPSWYFDVKQQGEGIVDVTTHVLDLLMWQCFPETVLDYKNDVEVLSASRWATTISLPEFETVTNEKDFPDFLKSDVKDGNLEVYANGEINLTIKGVHAKEVAVWNYEAPTGGGDTYRSVIKGTKADLIIEQGKDQEFKPVLYIRPYEANEKWESALKDGIDTLETAYPGIAVEQEGKRWKILIPEDLITTHEQHFAMVLEKYLGFLKEGAVPQWEKEALLAKYFITTKALEVAENR